MGKSSTSFKKGEVHNPHGRPKTGKSFADIMRKVIDRQTAVKRDKEGNILKTIKGKEVVAEAILSIAMDVKNNASVRLTAFNTALDRAYGKPLQTVDMSANVSGSSIIQNVKDSLDKLSPEEREEFLDLSEKLTDETDVE